MGEGERAGMTGGASRLEGFATSKGTDELMMRATQQGVHRTHFRSFEGLTFTSLGLGTYLGEPDDRTDGLVEEAIKRCILRGAINVIDTAINYRFQRAERSVGRAVRALVRDRAMKRDQLFIATKNGYLTHDGDLSQDFWSYIQNTLIRPGIIKATDISSQMNCMAVPFLKDQLERSLQNLGLECIDLMYLHNVAEGQIEDVGMERFIQMLRDAFLFYEEERSDGRIRFYGMATWTCFRMSQGSTPDYLSLDQVVKLAREVGGPNHGFRFVQLPYNLAMPEALTLRSQLVDGDGKSPFEAAEKLGLRIFASVPLLQGRLLSHPQLPKIEGLTSAQTCLQFCRSAPVGLLAPLVGQKNPKYIEENLGIAVHPPLRPEEIQQIFGIGK